MFCTWRAFVLIGVLRSIRLPYPRLVTIKDNKGKITSVTLFCFALESPISRSANELDSVRPQSVGEEQLQLQLAIAISKEEHDREERRRRAEAAKEEAKVQMVLEQSRREGQATRGWVSL
ncbi:Epsin-2 (EPS-15-interacting protein 2) (Intersectin-EH-binding protein 2) [Fasciolopsis buskii]|uniref:Epsin-2 (EPS-15-interacting protein 2) (Intersectin-EH-binding protein 2) n=1 Tax=Fasciolopsis buskii TaxID=27845 RepID=A0A8E0S616_9TREM|nr:Epsin-2 (EPS-15-interacting protein 2) (Intersectin-EH-binding protein 2) [Fasciolopsis buski]